MNAFVYRLTRLHRTLQDAIDRESERRVPNPIRLLRLKALRLAIKARLFRWQRRALSA